MNEELSESELSLFQRADIESCWKAFRAFESTKGEKELIEFCKTFVYVVQEKELRVFIKIEQARIILDSILNKSDSDLTISNADIILIALRLLIFKSIIFSLPSNTLIQQLLVFACQLPAAYHDSVFSLCEQIVKYHPESFYQQQPFTSIFKAIIASDDFRAQFPNKTTLANCQLLDLTLSLLNILSLEHLYQVTEIFLQNTEIIKSLFTTAESIYNKTHDDNLQLSLLSSMMQLFISIADNELIGFYMPLTTLILIEEDLIPMPIVLEALRFLKSFVRVSELKNDLCVIPVLFSEKVFVRAFQPEFQLLWIGIWERVIEIMELNEICLQIAVKFYRSHNEDYYENFSKFIDICNERYREIVFGLFRLGFTEKTALKANEMIRAGENTKWVIDVIAMLYKNAVDFRMNSGVIQVMMQDSLSDNNYFQKNCFFVLRLNITAYYTDNDIEVFVAELKKKKNAKLIYRLLTAIKDNFSEDLQKKLIELDIFSVLSGILKENRKLSHRKRTAKLWISVLNFLTCFTNTIELIGKSKFINFIITEIRKNAYKNVRIFIVESTVMNLLHLYETNQGLNYKLYPLLLEMSTTSSRSLEALRSNSKLFELSSLKLAKHKNINKIPDVILSHYMVLQENWDMYKYLLRKCLKVSISTKNLITICEIIKKSKCSHSKLLLELLYSIKNPSDREDIPPDSYKNLQNCANAVFLSEYFANTLKKYFVFNENSIYACSFTGLIPLRLEFSVALWLKPSKNCKNCVLAQLYESGDTKITISLINERIVISGTGNRRVFIYESKENLPSKTWSFLSVCIYLKNQKKISLFINNEVCKDYNFRGKVFKINLKSITIGCNNENSSKFIGKIAGFLISKKYFTEEETRMLSYSNYLKPLNLVSNEESKRLRILKSEIVFLLNPEYNIPSATSEISSTSLIYTKRIGCSLHDSLLDIGGLETFGILSLKNLDFNVFIEICRILLKFPQNSQIANVSTIELISYQLTNITIDNDAKSLYIRFIESIQDKKLQKCALDYFILTCRHNKVINSVGECDLLVRLHKNLNGFTLESFILIFECFKYLEQNDLSYIIGNYIEELKSKPSVVSLILTLIKSNALTIIEALLSIIDKILYEDESDTFIDTFLMLLMYPLKPKSHTSVLKIICSELNRILINAKDYERIVFKTLRLIFNRFLGITALLDFLEHFEMQISYQHVYLNKQFIDIILCKLRYIENIEDSKKILRFVQENSESINEIIYNREIFPDWLCELYKVSESLTCSLAVIIFTNLKPSTNLSKFTEFFRRIASNSASFKLFLQIFNKIDKSLLKQSNVVAEFVRNLEHFDIDATNNKEFFEVLDRLILYSIESGVLRVIPSFAIDETESSHHTIRILLKFIIQSATLNDSSMVSNLQMISCYTSYFKNFQNLNRGSKEPEQSLCLYIFASLAELIYSGQTCYNEFFETFCKNSQITSKLLCFFQSLTFQDIRRCNDTINRLKSSTISTQYLSKVEKNLLIIAPDIGIAQIKLIQDGLYLDALFRSDWIINIHFVLIVMIVLPIKNLKLTENYNSYKEDVEDKSDQDLARIVKITDNVIAVNVENRIEEAVMYLNYLAEKHDKRENRLINDIENMLEGAYYLKNIADRVGRRFIVKLTDRNFEKIDTDVVKMLNESLKRSQGGFQNESMILGSFNELVRQRKKSILKIQNQDWLKCEQIKVSGSYYGKIKVSDQSFEFSCKDKLKKENKYFGSALRFTEKSKNKYYMWRVEEIHEVLSRRFIHKNCALEVFFKNGKSVFFNLFSKKLRRKAFEQMKPWKNVRILTKIPKHLAAASMKQWSMGEISTFEYIMLLNKYSGRSFNDLSQYPVFPWVLAKYNQPVLETSDTSIYRDFSYPIGAQTVQMRESLSKKAHHHHDEFGCYNYGQHYSNGGIALHYLSRLEPYSTQVKILHDGEFDHPDRIFFSLDSAWRSTQANCGDNKELIPEFFYLPEIFENLNNCVMGRNELGFDSSEFLLPKWAENSWDFVRKHRKCLESSYVSANIHQWVDIIFGYKQSGEAAGKCYNLFHPITYHKQYKEFLRNADKSYSYIVDQAYHFGQTPHQLFKEPHLKRKLKKNESVLELCKQKSEIASKLSIFYSEAKFLAILGTKKIVLIYSFADEIKAVKFEKCVNSYRELKLKEISRSDFKKFLFGLWKDHIASAGYHDRSIKLHNLDGDLNMNLFFHSSPVTAVCIGDCLFTASYIIVSWSFRCQVNKKYNGHTSEVNAMSISSPLKLIVSSDLSGNTLIHHTSTCEILFSIRSYSNFVQFSDLGLLILGNHERINVYSLNGRLLWEVQVCKFEGCQINILGDLLVGISDCKLCVIDVIDKTKTFYPVEGIVGFSVGKRERKIFYAFAKGGFLQVGSLLAPIKSLIS